MQAVIATPEWLDSGPFRSASSAPTEEVSLGEALAQVRRFLHEHGEWDCVVSVPRSLDPQGQVRGVLLQQGFHVVSSREGKALKDLGMETPLGEWADIHHSLLLRQGGGARR